jgi:LAO/AO transport system kinase
MDHDAQHRLKGSAGTRLAPLDDGEWEPPILKTTAARDEGIAELAAGIGQHRAFLESSGKKVEREQSRAATQLVSLLRDRLLDAGLKRLERDKGSLSAVASQIASLKLDPYALADELVGSLAK